MNSNFINLLLVLSVLVSTNATVLLAGRITRPSTAGRIQVIWRVLLASPAKMTEQDLESPSRLSDCVLLLASFDSAILTCCDCAIYFKIRGIFLVTFSRRTRTVLSFSSPTFCFKFMLIEPSIICINLCLAMLFGVLCSGTIFARVT